MRRITFWALSTITTVVLLFGYHTSTMGASASAPPAAVSGLSPGQGTNASTSGTRASGSRVSGGSTTPTPAKPADRTVTGPVVGTAYGPVQVALQLQGSTISGVKVLQHPTGNPQSDQINSYALPVLVRETLDRQSSNIDMVSGATYTSMGYAQSLQSALDQAGL
jgi:uncharacterized protein with FMN-binding domain